MKIYVHIIFIDFKSAYDSIIREKLYEAISELQMPDQLIEKKNYVMCIV